MVDVAQDTLAEVFECPLDGGMSTLTEEIQAAANDMEARRLMWGMAEPSFEESAWYAFLAASKRLNALLREAKQGVGA